MRDVLVFRKFHAIWKGQVCVHVTHVSHYLFLCFLGLRFSIYCITSIFCTKISILVSFICQRKQWFPVPVFLGIEVFHLLYHTHIMHKKSFACIYTNTYIYNIYIYAFHTSLASELVLILKQNVEMTRVFAQPLEGKVALRKQGKETKCNEMVNHQALSAVESIIYNIHKYQNKSKYHRYIRVQKI